MILRTRPVDVITIAQQQLVRVPPALSVEQRTVGITLRVLQSSAAGHRAPLPAKQVLCCVSGMYYGRPAAKVGKNVYR
jgi:hypothetical protein